MQDPQTTSIQLTQQLIECPSITPADAGCQIILGEHLEKIGFTVQHLAFQDVQNLWAIRGTKGPIFVFAGHTDVVPPGNLEDWKSPPFTPAIVDGYLYGRGAADMKGSLAAMITATERFVTQYPEFNGSLAFLITSDEEGRAENGTVQVMEYLKSQGVHLDYCLIGEPSSHTQIGDVLKNGRRGSLNGTLKVLGKQGHIAHPHKADNPIHRAFLPLTELINTIWDQGNAYFPATTFQISNIKSGTGAVNVIPGVLECQFNFRFSTEVTPEKLLSRVKTILNTHHLNYALDWHLSGQPFLTKSGRLVTACQKAIQTITGRVPKLSTDGGTSDGRFIAPTGTEVIELGPCNTTIHCVNECVNIEDLNILSKLYEQILKHILG